MNRATAEALVDRLAGHYGHRLDPWARALYIDTLEPFAPGVGRMAVGTIESRTSAFPTLAILADQLEVEQTHWTTPGTPQEPPAAREAVRAGLAAARRALGQT